jgi:hypothetical protein
MSKACSTNGEKRNAYRIFLCKPQGKRLLGTPRRKWVNNIKRDLRAIGWGGVNCIDLVRIETSGGLF